MAAWPSTWPIEQIKAGPHQQAENYQRCAKMYRQPILGNGGVFRQARFHHPPANHALKPAKQ